MRRAIGRFLKGAGWMAFGLFAALSAGSLAAADGKDAAVAATVAGGGGSYPGATFALG